MLNDISQWPWIERQWWMEIEERKRQPEREKNLLLSTIASLFNFFFSRSPLLSFSSCLVSHSCSHSLLRRLSICEGPTSLLSKNHTAVPIQKPHAQYRIIYRRTHSYLPPIRVLKERLFFPRLGSDTQQWACPTGILSETDKQCELESLIFSSDTFSPQFVSMYIWSCHCHLTVLVRVQVRCWVCAHKYYHNLCILRH